MHDIVWPVGFVPGFTDNFCSNEVIVTELSVAKVWPLLINPTLWSSYYNNASNPHFHDNKGPELGLDVCFSFETFGVVIESHVVECHEPINGQPARIAWHGWAGEGEGRIEVHHAWILEELSAGRLRILTQETQNGAMAKELAQTVPNPMINAHQAWLDGLVKAARNG